MLIKNYDYELYCYQWNVEKMDYEYKLFGRYQEQEEEHLQSIIEMMAKVGLKPTLLDYKNMDILRK